MNSTHYISSSVVSIEALYEIIFEEKKIALSEEATSNISKCRAYLDKRMLKDEDPIYGINTGFGSLCHVKISNENLSKLQENLVKSHACGMGDEVPKPIVKLMLLLKIQSLSYGHSGVQLVTVQRLVDFYNEDVLPQVPEAGSLGASGDLAPLAHLTLPLLGHGKVCWKGNVLDSGDAHKKLGLTP
jgi:histidine ammonia-lyase